MIEYLKELLQDLKNGDNDFIPTIIIQNIKQKEFALETAIEIFEKIRKE